MTHFNPNQMFELKLPSGIGNLFVGGGGGGVNINQFRKTNTLSTSQPLPTPLPSPQPQPDPTQSAQIQPCSFRSTSSKGRNQHILPVVIIDRQMNVPPDSPIAEEIDTELSEEQKTRIHQILEHMAIEETASQTPPPPLPPPQQQPPPLPIQQQQPPPQQQQQQQPISYPQALPHQHSGPLSMFTIMKLKTICRDHGLPIKGTKKQLYQQLVSRGIIFEQ